MKRPALDRRNSMVAAMTTASTMRPPNMSGNTSVYRQLPVRVNPSSISIRRPKPTVAARLQVMDVRSIRLNCAAVRRKKQTEQDDMRSLRQRGAHVTGSQARVAAQWIELKVGSGGNGHHAYQHVGRVCPSPPRPKPLCRGAEERRGDGHCPETILASIM